MSPSPDLNELVVRCLGALEESGPAGVDAILAEHPEHAERLRSRLSSLREAGLVQSAPDESPPERLGEFRLLERLGAGGMGVVWLAEQPSLGRRVALKLVRPDQLYFGGARERFRREVEAVARLQHPGIVPVHAFGEQDGVPYYAMEHVRGLSLDEVLSRVAGRSWEQLSGAMLFGLLHAAHDGQDPGRPEDAPFDGDWEHACLWIAREVAQALEHAHQRGVLHRDVKPSNVMVTSSGRVVLLDFGLASHADASSLTRSGSFLGSLPYMAPEQLLGDPGAIDARTDVYGLGVLLYELLARRPAFPPGEGALLQQRILEADAPRLRALEPRVARDVEALVAVAMDPDRERRYASAADLARDLTNVLEGRPIEARPAGAWVQLGRWTARRPWAATALALGLVIAVGGPLVFGLQQSRAAKAQLELTAEADDQRALAEQRLGEAMGAIEAMLTRVAAVELRNVPGYEGVRVELFAAARELYDRLAAEAEPSVELSRARLDVALSLAALALDLQRAGEARDALEGAERDLQHLRDVGAEPADGGARLDSARGRLALLERDPRGALEHLDQALDDPRPPDEQDPFDRASAMHNRASTLRLLGRGDEAIVQAEEAAQLLEEARATRADDRLLAALHVEVLSHLGVLHHGRGDDPTAIEVQLEGLRLGDQALAGDDDDAVLQQRLLECCLNLANPLRMTGRIDDGLRVTAQGLEHAEWVRTRFPSDAWAQLTEATLWLNRGLLLWEGERREEALGALDRALAGFEALAGDDDLEAQGRLRAASVLANRGGLLQELERYDEALEDLDRALEVLAPETARADAEPEYVLQTAVAFGNRSLVHLSRGAWQASLDDLRESLPRFRVSPGVWPELARQAMALVEGALGDVELGAAELDDLVEATCATALDALERAQGAGTLGALDADDPLWEPLVGRDRFERLAGR